jgi:hypothetical protein
MHADIDYMINMHKIKEEGPAKSASLVVHRGPVWVSLMSPPDAPDYAFAQEV